MKYLILKWLGVPHLLDEAVRIKTEEAIKSFKNEVINFVIGDLNNKYDLDGLVSKFEDLQGSFEDGEYRWDNTAHAVDSIVDVDELIYKDDIQELKDKLDQVQEIDDRLTQLVAGYRLDVQLIKEEF
jgi:hypothetical protein